MFFPAAEKEPERAPEQTVTNDAAEEAEGIETLRAMSPPAVERRTSGIGSSRQPPNVITRATSPPRKTDSEGVETPSHQSAATGSPAANHTSVLMTSNSPPSSPVPQWECDYDTSPTDLYQAIEAMQWDFVLGMFSDNVSEVAAQSVNQQCATWVVRKESNGKLRWRLLPLHAACIFQAPSMVILLLLQEFPHSAAAKDDQGMLPLHLAFRQQPMNFTVLEELMTAYPSGVTVKDRRGRTPLQAVAQPPKEGEAAAPAEVSNSGAPAAVISLFSQISLTAAKRELAALHQTDMEQRLHAVAEEQAGRWTEMKTDFAAQVEVMAAKIAGLERDRSQLVLQHVAESNAHENVLYITQEQLTTSQTQMREIQEELTNAQTELTNTQAELTAVKSESAPRVVMNDASAPPPNSTPESTSGMSLLHSLPSFPPSGVVQIDRMELTDLVQTLLGQQSSLTLQLDAMSKKLQEKRDQRSSLLRQLGAIDISDETEDPVPELKMQMKETKRQVSNRVSSITKKYANIGDSLVDLAPVHEATEQEYNNTTTSTSKVVDVDYNAQAKTVDEKDREARARIPNFTATTTVVDEKKEGEPTEEKTDKDILNRISLQNSDDNAAFEATVDPSSP
jgi:hypothetical protein